MKKLCIALLLLGACGRNESINDIYSSMAQGFTEYTPPNYDIIAKEAQKISKTEDKTLAVRFYYGTDKQVNTFCNTDALACTTEVIAVGDVLNFIVIAREDQKDRCDIVLHELLHDTFELKTGDPDAKHKSKEFKLTTFRCVNDLGIPLDGVNRYPDDYPNYVSLKTNEVEKEVK